MYYYFAGPLNIWSCKTYRNLHLAHRAARKSAARANIFVHELHRIDWTIRRELKGTKGCTKNKNCRDCKIKLKEK